MISKMKSSNNKKYGNKSRIERRIGQGRHPSFGAASGDI